MCDTWEKIVKVINESREDVRDRIEKELTENIYENYSGGPLVLDDVYGAPDPDEMLVMMDSAEMMEGMDLEPPTSPLTVYHDIGVDGVTCRKCKKTTTQIAENPHEECLWSLDFSEVTKGLVGGR